MIQSIYFIKDDVSGEYSMFGTFSKTALAIRAFKTACNHEDVPVSDLSLYHCCNFDSNNGIVTPINPEFIFRGDSLE